MNKPLDYSIEAETPAGALRNALAILDSDHRVGFWERRVAQAAVRRRIEQALALLEPREP
jgi:hypothetical protein